MRFIINFILFGLLFYAIWYFFPDGFNKLVSGAHAIFDFIKNMIDSIAGKVRTPAPTTPEQPALIAPWLLITLRNMLK